MAYVSGSRATNRYCPVESVIAVFAPVRPVSVTVTPGRIPPCSSRTTPEIPPVCVCAYVTPAEIITSITAAVAINVRRTTPPDGCDRKLKSARRVRRVNAIVHFGVDAVADARSEQREHNGAL